MEYEDLIAEFGAHCQIEGLRPNEDGIVGVSADGRILTFQFQEETGCVLAQVELGEAPSESVAMLNDLLMKANQAIYALDGMAIVRHQGTGRFVLLSRFEITALDFAGFDKRIARLLQQADRWGPFLENLAPLAAEAESREPGPSDDRLPVADLLRV